MFTFLNVINHFLRVVSYMLIYNLSIKPTILTASHFVSRMFLRKFGALSQNFMKIHETFLYTEHYRGLNREICFLYLISINVCKPFSY